MNRRRGRSPGAVWGPAGTPVDALPLVAIVGRPNVGKSTLVNRLVGRRDAIVEERPGVTRDRKYFEVEWLGRRFRVVDTGGWLSSELPLDQQVAHQAELAIAEADVVVLVTDITVGVTDEDAAVAALLQRAGAPVLVVANKADHPNRDADAWDFGRLGLGDPISLSAMHGRSSDVLLDTLLEHLPPPPADDTDHEDERSGDDGRPAVATVADPGGTPDDDDTPSLRAQGGAPGPEDAVRPFAVAIVGRPNVGKSTLFNRLIGDERSIVHDLPGTTRDTIDTVIETEEGVLRIVDTAGIRRRSRIDDGVEWFSLIRALKAVDAADATLLVLDASEGVTHQDQRLAERVDAAGCAVVVVLNKWDLVDPERREEVVAAVGDRLGFVGYAPVLRVSALTGRGALRILPALRQARREYRRRVPTARLNVVIQEAQRRHPPPLDGGARPRVLYATQGATDPPTFTLFANRTLPPTYLRYLERSIRESFSFGPTPIKVRVRRRER